jgi:hypothetical protein
MRLSEAIALGRTAIQPASGRVFNSDRTRGCAFGMAGAAIGAKWSSAVLEHDTERAWPWLRGESIRPCKCPHWRQSGTYLQAIAHLFDAHLMQDRCYWWDIGEEAEPMTLDQLIDWVRSVEPQEVAVEAPRETNAAASSRLLPRLDLTGSSTKDFLEAL